MSGPDRRGRESALVLQLLTLLKSRHVRRLSVYLPYKGEPDALPILDAGLSIAGCLPVCMPDERLQFAHWKPGDMLVEGRYGIAVPALTEWVTPDAVLVPCVAFDARCYRLGYGGGWFDRTLANASGEGRPWMVGVAFDEAYVDALPVEPHDQALDVVVTPSAVFKPD